MLKKIFAKLRDTISPSRASKPVAEKPAAQSKSGTPARAESRGDRRPSGGGGGKPHPQGKAQGSFREQPREGYGRREEHGGRGGRSGSRGGQGRGGRGR